MNYLDIITSGAAAVLSSALFLFHIMKKERSIVNGFFSFTMIIAAVLFILHCIYSLPPNAFDRNVLARGVAVFLLYFFTALFALNLSYPMIIRKTYIIPVLLAPLPGIAVGISTAATDLVIMAAPDPWSITPGPYFAALPAALGAYAAGSLLVPLVKSLLTVDRSFARELLLLFAGSVMAVSATVLFAFVIPTPAPASAVILSLVFLILLLHTAVKDIERLDILHFYERTAYWIFVVALLLVPVYAIMYFRRHAPQGLAVPTALTAAVIFLYLFLFFKYARPRIDLLFQKRRRDLTELVNDSFLSIGDFREQDEKFLWTDFLRSSMIKLLNNFEIDRGALYLHDTENNSFSTVYVSGDRASFPDLDADSPILQSLNIVRSTLTLQRFYSNARLQPLKETALKLLGSARIQMVIPFFNHEEKLTGLLLLGRMRTRKYYGSLHVSVFELYRIQFQQQFLSIVILEEAKKRQAAGHDMLVVSSIRKTILPRSMSQIEGMRISSFCLGDSPSGFDYFDSIALSDGRLLVFMSDSSYNGIDSAVASLQLYGVLHTPSKYLGAPDRLLTTMNWLLATSSLSVSGVPAFALTCSKGGEIHYSSASGNPLYLYNPRAGTFTSHATKGSPLGARRDALYDTGTVRAVPGSIGILHSAGLFRAKNGKGEAYSADALRGLVSASRGDTPAVITRKIYEDYRFLMGDSREEHNFAVIVFRV